MGTRLAQLLALVAASVCGCSTGSRDSNARDLDVNIELWPIPGAGLASVPNPFGEGGGGSAGQQTGTAVHTAGAPSLADAGVLPPGDPSLALLDPGQVYLFGTLAPPSCEFKAIAPVLAHSEALVGFECGSGPAFIRPSDGRFIYDQSLDDEALYAFHCDGCVHVDTPDPYPDYPRANDEHISTSACAESNASRFDVFVSVHGEIVYHCSDHRWYVAGGAELEVLAGRREGVASFGYENTALMSNVVVDLSTGAESPLDGFPAGRKLARRARTDGYWVAVEPHDGSAPPELWHVGFDATATPIGTYPSSPQDLTPSTVDAVLDGEGRLFQSGFLRQSGPATLARSIDGQSEIVYRALEARFRGSELVTGP